MQLEAEKAEWRIERLRSDPADELHVHKVVAAKSRVLAESPTGQ